MAGCATQPPTWGHTSFEHSPDGQEIASAGSGTVLRIGVEYLPPELGDESAPRVERATVRRSEHLAPAPTTLDERRLVPEARHTWALSAEDLGAIDDPFARETLRFMDDMVREDRRRTEHEVRLPFLEAWKPTDLELGQRLWSEETIAEAQAEWVHENGPRVLSRPFRRMLRRLPIVNDVEVSFDDFRSSFVPMSKPYRDAHERHRSLGRLSVRLHAGDLADPLEVVYIRSGVRIGSSQDRGKFALDLPLAENVDLQLRTRYDYLTSESELRADLSYRVSPRTSVRFAVGDDMDFLSTSSIYSMFEAPMDGGPGLLMYAVHVF